MKFDKKQQQTALALFIVAIVCASLLAGVNAITKEPIAQAQRQALHQALEQVLPPHHNDPLSDAFIFPLTPHNSLKIFPAKNKQGKVIALAWQQVAPDGYSGSIHILMGVNHTGNVVAIRITHHRETPGLGDGITKDDVWLHRFKDKNLHNIRWAVQKDGGDFDQFTGATITPRAVVKAVHQGLEFFHNNQTNILSLARQQPSPK